jgi:ADP-heptose:LPS heptosyltransferase
MPVIRSKQVTRKTLEQRPEKLMREMGLKEFYAKRNKLLFLRGVGGLGDIFMHRMLFEDIKRLAPDAEIHFACPRYYHDAVSDHPFIDLLIDSNELDRQSYLVCYNTTTACGKAEMKLAPFSGPHRSDIWAAHCGFLLTRHEMHFRISEEEKTKGKEIIERHRDRPGKTVLISAISAMHNKNLSETQLVGLVRGLRERGLCPIGLHNAPMWDFIKNDFPAVGESRLRNWMSVLDQADYVVSVDSAAFHCAGGLKKPLVGIFTFASADAYGKYYSTAELLQGPCPYNRPGCYNWGTCPDQGNPKPCLTQITSEMILSCVDKVLEKYPKGDSL